ncbi:J domain-containing protein [Acidithiobacillus ferrooxidans]|uniref:J domain-containing protein n=1 Tax=Acidithiobacillus ferrooxidans TaxID=920 RepID=UPI00214B104B|nr:J domain-containing protein [Acidithiobacillus ferrooxidans]MCR2830692.1 J domain-containing protein [Acidithiobacillus ferrooxidans]
MPPLRLPALVMTQPAQTDTLLSPEQKTFHRLSQQIAKVRQQMDDWESAMEATRQRVLKDLLPLRDQHLQLRIQLLVQLDTISLTQKLGKADSETLSQMIARLAENLMKESSDSQLQEIYDRHGGPDAEEQAMFAEMKASMEGFFNLNPEAAGADAGKGSSEKPGAWTEEETPQRQSQRESQRTRPKTGRQKAQEARQAEQAGQIRQSLQGIYRRLVSAVHPDREADPILRAQKTALMQRINQAYGENDLLQLLALQHESGLMEAQAVHQIGDAQLKKYNQALKEHLATLNGKMQTLQQHLAGRLGIPLFAIHSPHALSRDLQETIQATRQAMSGLRQEMKRLSQPAYVKRWIKTARRELASEDYIDDDFF